MDSRTALSDTVERIARSLSFEGTHLPKRRVTPATDNVPLAAMLAKIVAEAAYGEVLGVHMIGHNVSELIAEAGIARMLEATLDEIASHAPALPTAPEAVMEAAQAGRGRATHI